MGAHYLKPASFNNKGMCVGYIIFIGLDNYLNLFAFESFQHECQTGGGGGGRRIYHVGMAIVPRLNIIFLCVGYNVSQLTRFSTIIIITIIIMIIMRRRRRNVNAFYIDMLHLLTLSYRLVTLFG